MGILGSLLYPGNPKMAKEINEKEDQLRKNNNLHNDIVNSYRKIGEATKTFDAYLMAIMTMQYHLAYTQEDLSNLPNSKAPALTKSWADSVETLALDTLSVKMAVDGFKAIGNGVANLFREGGIFNRTSTQGQAAVDEGLGEEIVTISERTPLLRSSSIDLLTTEAQDAELGDMATELGDTAVELSDAVDAASQSGEAVGDLAEASDVAETGAAAAEAATETASIGSKLVSGAMAALGPILLVVTVVTEVISAIHAGQEHSKLKDAEKQLDELLNKQEAALADLKGDETKDGVFNHLLKSAKADIETYNKMLPDLYALEKAPIYQRDSFSVLGIEDYIDGLKSVSTDTAGSISAYESVASQNLGDATDYIRQQAEHDGEMTEAVGLIKSYMRRRDIDDLPDDSSYLSELSDVMSIGMDQAVRYNKFRRLIAEYGSLLLPYHEKTQKDNQKGGIAMPPEKVPQGKPNPGFDPKPEAFIIPGIAVGRKD